MNEKMKKISKLINSKFQVKAVKTFMGREGYGVNANLYYSPNVVSRWTKVALLIDSGNGGCLDVDWLDFEIGRKNNPIDELIKEFPKTTWEDRYGKDEFGHGDYKWDEESVCNFLVDEFLAKKDFKKMMKKISVLTAENKIASYQAKSSDIDTIFNFKNMGKGSYRELISKDKSVKLILNDLPINEAFEIYQQNK